MKNARHITRLFRPIVEALEDRDAPALFGPVDETVDVGDSPRAIVMADFDRDNRLDLAVANGFSDDVTILFGDGSGHFSTRSLPPVAVGTNPLDLAVGDFNRDGIPDLAVPSFSRGTVTVLLGNGSGGFSPAAGSPFAVGDLPRDIAVGDFNVDGRLDLAVGNSSSDDVTILLGNGAGGFSPAASSPVAVGDSPDPIAVGDLNGDGLPDLAVGNAASHDMTILLGNGGSFSPVAGSPITTAFGPNYMEVGDFNGDGKLDLVVGHGQLSILLGSGGGHFSEATGSPFSLGNSNNSVAVSDVNGDGISDLSVGLFTGMAVLLGTGAGRFNPTPGSPFAIGQLPDDVIAGDFNNDGLPDFATANSRTDNVTILLNHGGTTTTLSTSDSTAVFGQTVTFTAIVKSAVPTGNGQVPTGTVTFTIDGNPIQTGLSGGVANLAVPSLGVGTHLVTVKFTSDAFASSTSATLTQRVAQVATATNLFGPVKSPAAGQTTTLTAIVTGVDAGALNVGSVTFMDGGTVLGVAPLSNGTATLPVTFTTTGTHLILAQLAGGANFLGSSSAIVTIEVVGSAHKIVTGSGPGGQPLVKVFNTDGTLDRSFLAFGPAYRGGVRVAKGDVNGDGVDDIIAAPAAGLAPHVRVFDGTTGAEFRSFFAFGRGFTSGVFVAAGDVDGDGKADIMAGQGKLGSKVRVFSGDTGAELFHVFAYDAAFKGGVRVAAGDVNGDGHADVIVGGGAGPTQKVRILDATGNHDELFSFLPFGTTFGGGVFVAAGDVNGDQRADVIVTPSSSSPPTLIIVDVQTRLAILSFPAFDPTFLGGARVATEDVDGDGLADMIVAPGAGHAPLIRVFRANTSDELLSFLAFDPAFVGGAYIG